MPSPDLPPELPLGTFARFYDLEELLGYGGSAVVYRAYDRRRGEEVALKALTVTDWDRRRWEQEVRNLRERLPRLGLVHVLPVYDIGEWEQVPFFTMPLCRGRSLQDWVRDCGRIPIAQAVRLVQALASDLDLAHSGGLLHRDIKPSNLLYPGAWPESNEVALGDWGIAEHREDETLTETGAAVGSRRYMSPQRRANGKATAADDQYALAKSVEDALTGYGSVRQKTSRDMPREIAAVLGRAMDDDPAGRYRTMTEFAQAFVAAAAPLLSAAPARAAEARAVRVAAEQTDGHDPHEATTSLMCPTGLARVSPHRPRGEPSPATAAEDEVARLAASLSAQAARNQELERRLAASQEHERDSQNELAASLQENAELKRRVAHEIRARDDAVAAAKASARAAEASAQAAASAAARGAARRGVSDEQRVQEYSVQASAAGAANAAGARPDASVPRATAASPGSPTGSRSWAHPSMSSVADGVVNLGEFRRRRRQSRQQASREPDADFTWETPARESRHSSGQLAASRRRAVVWHEVADGARQVSFALFVSLLVVAALTCVGAFLAVLRRGLPTQVAGPLAAVSITSLALAAICHVMHAGLQRRRDALPSAVCAVCGLLALIESYIAVRHHTAPWHLTQGELAAVGITLLLLSLLVGVRGTQPVRVLLLILTLVTVVPVGPLMAVLVPLVFVLWLGGTRLLARETGDRA